MSPTIHLSRRHLGAIAAALLASLLPGGRADAAPTTFVVTMVGNSVPTDPVGGTCTSGVSCSLRQAIAAANANAGADTITFAADGPINLNPAISTGLVLTDDVIITGRGNGATEVNANGAATHYRTFQVDAGVTATMADLGLRGGNADGSDGTPARGGNVHNFGTLTLNDLEIRLGEADSGGNVHNENGATLTMSRVGIYDGVSGVGGGGGVTNQGTLTMTGVELRANRAGFCIDGDPSADNCVGDGGAILNENGSLTVTESSIGADDPAQGNVAAVGGAILSLGASFEISRSQIRGNVAHVIGAGVVEYGTGSALREVLIEGNVNTGNGATFPTTPADLSGLAAGLVSLTPLTLERVAILDNDTLASFGNGGGMVVAGDVVDATDVVIAGNRAGGLGGGVFAMDFGLTSPPTVNLDRTSIVENTSDLGGGLYLDPGTGGSASLLNTTISGNAGGGLVMESGSATVTFSTVAENSAGGVVAGDGTATLRAVLLADNENGNCDVTGSGSIASNGENLANDGSCALGASGDITSNVRPMIPTVLGPPENNGGGDHALTHAPRAGNPAIDAAGAACALAAIDAVGTDRPQDGACDIGALEFVAPEGEPTPTTTGPSSTTTPGISPTTVAAPPELPRTGRSSAPLGLIAFVAIALGTLALRVARRRGEQDASQSMGSKIVFAQRYAPDE